jgi:hypothetical protein
MWLRAVRKRLVSRALAAVLAAVVCGGALDWGHAGGDDPDCDPVFVHHDHSAHRWTAAPAQSVPPADHCYICHSLRLLHSSVAARGARVVLAVHSVPYLHVDSRNASGATLRVRSSRAPPLASL